MLDVVVIGAGYAGLAAALRLHDAGADFVLLEAAERVGGRILSETRAPGLTLDHGGQWVGPTQRQLLALADRFACETFPTWENGEHIEIWRDGTRVPYTGAIPDDGPGIREYKRITDLLDDLARTVDTAQPWRTPGFAEWDGQTALTFFRSQTSDEDTLCRLALAIQGVWCAEPYEISFFHVLFYIASAGSFHSLMETGGGAQDSRFLLGADGPARAIAEMLGPRLRLGEPVSSVEQCQGFVRVNSLEARRAIVALPPGAVRAVDFRPRLPVSRDGWLSHSPMGRVAKVHVIYASPFWRGAGLSGVATLYSDSPVGVVFDNSPPDTSIGVLVAFIYGDRLSTWSALDKDARRAAVLAAMTQVVGPGDPLDYTEKIWSLDRFVHGGYEAFVAPGGWTGYGEHGWRAPTGLIHWAGTETASTWNGYIDGAISSGYRAADEVL
ncbi:FAD-dependent oxidoreductase [Kibdelosporangium philippinense]|uniref:FAD-dependent oxidoreductase n=1 Tax=Kibdelosporangium philippinense TaxID=211113 RepID=A0ABS8ZJZ3_9PSEU|nr:NAD(P)/FAD-dependent oxidoreductase [Kibdelosporangium philippinense]MCE7008123.1 FAD-dependent oxidoreductase [Kibdelosporangium philippinense]